MLRVFGTQDPPPLPGLSVNFILASSVSHKLPERTFEIRHPYVFLCSSSVLLYQRIYDTVCAAVTSLAEMELLSPAPPRCNAISLSRFCIASSESSRTVKFPIPTGTSLGPSCARAATLPLIAGTLCAS